MRQEHQHRKHQVGTKRWHRWALNLGAVLGSLCLILAALTFMFGLKPLIFASGSMGPQIPTGSLGIAVPTPVAEVLPNQVVSVVTSDGTRITHRVMENRPEGLVLKGDANAVADLQPYAVADADRLLFSVPLLGYVVSWFSQPWAFFLGGLLCAYLLYVAFIRPESGSSSGDGDRSEASVDDAAEKAPDPGSWHRAFFRTCTVLTVLTLVAGLGVNAGAERTSAAFSGSASASASATTLTAVPLTGATCTNNAPNAQTIRFDWASGNPAPTGYKVTGQLNGSATAPKTETLPAGTLSYSTSISAETGLLGSLLNLLLGFDNRFTVKISAVYGSWESAPVIYDSVHGTAGLLGANKKLTCS
ncbi:MAG: hypothetical protein ABWX89_07045 [Paeniglutamicibacter terrestris]